MPEENQPEPIDASSLDNSEGEFPAPAPESTGNRPADGARLATPGEVLDEAFQGSENAGDFLGLDTEFTSSIGADLELAQAPGAPMPAPAGDHDAPAPQSTADVMDVVELDDLEDEFLSDEDDQYLDELDGDGVGEYQDDFEGTGEFAYEDEGGGGSSKLLVVGSFIAGLALVIGVTMGPRLLDGLQKKETGTPIAQGPNQPIAPTGSGAAAGLADTASTEVATASSTGAEGPETNTGSQPESTGLEVAENLSGTGAETNTNAGDLAVEDATGTSEVFPAEKFAAGDPGAPPTEATQGGGTESTGFQDDLLAVLTNPEPRDDAGSGTTNASSFPDFSQGFEWVTDDKLDMIWRGETIPMEAIAAPARTLMPRVGRVRAFLVGGDSIDGRLYALGQDRVWIQMERGVFGLDGALVERIEPTSQGSSGVSGVGTRSTQPTGARVRVQLPGGALYGRIHSRNGEFVTLMTDRGGKVILKNPEIQELGSERAIVVER